MALLLDTHIWFWFATSDERIRPHDREIIAQTGADQDVHVSIISLVEIATLVARGRMELSMSCEQWLEIALSPVGIALAGLSPEIAIASAQLPGDIHGDPMDRIIVATARSLGARLVTRDRRLLAYGRAGHVDVLEA